jgi:hypothetical protein
MIERLSAIFIIILFVVAFGLHLNQKTNWFSPKIDPSPPSPLVFPSPAKVSLLAVGDIMLDRGVEQMVNQHGGGDFNFVFAELKDFKSGADLVIGNLEGPAAWGGVDSGGEYSFHASPLSLSVLKAIGFDILTVANNHANDWGPEAFVETLDNLAKNEIAFIGGSYNYSLAREPVIFEKNNLRLGFLGFSDVGPAGLVAGQTPGILSASDPNFSELINKASQQVDVLVVSIHWGEEYQVVHNPRQSNIARQAIDAGAKIVLGHHPHVVQDEEYYKAGYVAYSLGNFVFDQYFSQATMEGLALKLEIDKDGVTHVEKKLVKLNKRFQPSWAE